MPPWLSIFVSLFKVDVGKPLCTIDGDEASVVRAKLEAAQLKEGAEAPPPEVRLDYRVRNLGNFCA